MTRINNMNLVTINQDLAATYDATYEAVMADNERGMCCDWYFEEEFYDEDLHRSKANKEALQETEELLNKWIFEDEDLERRWEGRRKYKRRM